MAKTNYLNIVNRILQRVNLTTISDVTAATGQSLVISNLVNEAQNELFTELNWYSLYATRTFSTVAGTETYAMAADFGRNIDMMDVTNNTLLVEEYTKNFDLIDPNDNDQGNPTMFAQQGANYRLWRIPAGVYTMRERYWALPTALAANTDTSTLPIEAENALIHWTWYKTLEYLNKFDAADRCRVEFERLLKRARVANDKILDKMNIMNPVTGLTDGIAMPKFPSSYGPTYY